MEKIVLKATRRNIIGKQVKAMRRAGQLPAVIYGHSVEPRPITLDMRETTKILSTLGSSSLITINLEGEELTALVRDKQRDYIKVSFLHVDFLVVSMTETIRAKVPVVIIGTSPAVRDLNAVAEQQLNEIEIQSLPGNLPENFTIDISSLTGIGDHILIKDLDVPEGVEILMDADDVIISITAPTTSVEELETEAAEGEPEVIEKGKKEEEKEE